MNNIFNEFKVEDVSRKKLYTNTIGLIDKTTKDFKVSIPDFSSINVINSWLVANHSLLEKIDSVLSEAMFHLLRHKEEKPMPTLLVILDGMVGNKMNLAIVLMRLIDSWKLVCKYKENSNPRELETLLGELIKRKILKK